MELCEVCSAEATCEVFDIRETEPVKTEKGDVVQQFERVGAPHALCSVHRYHTKVTLRPGTSVEEVAAEEAKRKEMQQRAANEQPLECEQAKPEEFRGDGAIVGSHVTRPWEGEAFIEGLRTGGYRGVFRQERLDEHGFLIAVGGRRVNLGDLLDAIPESVLREAAASLETVE